METTVKNTNVSILKNDIKKLVNEQKNLRNQRKTVNLKGERTMDPSTAQYVHTENRYKLRLMYAAYGLMRGKSFSQMEKNHPEENHPLKNFLPQISKLIETYSPLIDKKE